MSCMNLHHYLKICGKNLIQTICDTRSASKSYILIDSLKLVSKCVLRKNVHTTKRGGVQSLCHLKSRGVIQLSGEDTPEFLQGLVTNNVWLLTEKVPSVQYCMMLNVQGRVLYDLFVYNITKTETDPITFLVEADAAAVDDLLKIFKKYKLRKKVDISSASDSYKIWTEFDIGEGSQGEDNIPQATENTFKFHDPRVPVFASRIVTDQENLDARGDKVTEDVYRKYRYQWGIPEGVVDLPSGKCLPLESNLEYMNGVNFQKGCYIGQELTARTFHTGVIRKRLLPVILDPPATIEPEATVTAHEKGKTAGKFRSSEGNYGLCLLRLEHVEDSLQTLSKDGQVISLKAQIPKWWPSSSS